MDKYPNHAIQKYPIQKYKPGAIVESVPPLFPNPHHPTHVESGLIAVAVFALIAMLGYSCYSGYNYIFTLGRQSMKADIQEQMLERGYHFCKDQNAPDSQQPQAYNNYTVSKIKEDSSNI